MITSVQSDERFDYHAPAELFPSKNRWIRSRVLSMRFADAADAIRFATDKLPADVLLGSYLEVDEKSYDSRGIRRLYDHSEYPFSRLAEAA